MDRNAVWCKCGERFTEISQLENVRQLGLSLRGDCPVCGDRHFIGSLWKAKERIVKGGETWQAQ
jgi:hypothetical protein